MEMMKSILSRTIVPSLVILAAGCAPASGLVSLGSLLAEAALPPRAGEQRQQGQLSAEVQEVDEIQRRIRVVTQAGQRGTLRYDTNTRVVRQQQNMPVDALQPGDRVLVQIEEDADQNVYATLIEVYQPAGQAAPAAAQPAPQPVPVPVPPVPAEEREAVREYRGTIESIDHDEGTFVLDTEDGRLTVLLPLNPPQATVSHFHRLRAGQAVRLEARSVASQRVEIHRFL
jgi:hypothetical protein